MKAFVFTIIFTILTLMSFEQTSLAESVFKDEGQASSDYIEKKTCQKIESKYSKKYDSAYFYNIFNKSNDEIPSIEQIISELTMPDGGYTSYETQLNILKLARCQRSIDDVVFNLIQTKILQDEDQLSETPQRLSGPSMEIKTYLLKKNTIKKISTRDERSSQVNPFPLSRFSMKVFESRNVSVKERLYALYSPEQIKKMALGMSLALNVMDAVKVETTIVFREDTERKNYVVEHTPSDVYRLALRIFNMEKKKLTLESSSRGLPFTNLDILAAAYEMGVVSENEISILTSDEYFYKEDKPFIRKLGNYLTSLGLMAAQINPTTAPYALIGLILYNAYQETKQGGGRIEYENFYFN